jgi:hypothetical protein
VHASVLSAIKAHNSPQTIYISLSEVQNLICCSVTLHSESAETLHLQWFPQRLLGKRCKDVGHGPLRFPSRSFCFRGVHLSLLQYTRQTSVPAAAGSGVSILFLIFKIFLRITFVQSYYTSALYLTTWNGVVKFSNNHWTFSVMFEAFQICQADTENTSRFDQCGQSTTRITVFQVILK